MSDSVIIGAVFAVWAGGSITAVLMGADTTRRLILGSFGRVQPIVRLVSDMLDAETGWAAGYHHYQHQTGVEVYLRYDGFVRSLSIDGSDVTLSAADKLKLQRAIKRLDKRKKAASDDKAARLLAERARAFSARAEQFADTVVPLEKRA